MEIWETVEPAPENVIAVKKNYNRLIARVQKADEFLKTVQDQEKYAIEIRIELLEPMAKYIYVLNKWSINVSNKEITDGFEV